MREDNNHTIDSSFDQLKSLLVGKQDFVDQDEFISFQIELFERLAQLEAKLNDKERFDSMIVESKERVVDVVSPKMGKIIRTSINLQIEKINQKIKDTSTEISDSLKPSNLLNRFLGRSKVHYTDYPQILQLFCIEKDSGLLIGKFQKTVSNDPDMMSGLLTSIKTFAESALSMKDAEVGLIDYGDSFIKLFNYGTYYFALVFDGKQNKHFESFINEEIDAFANRYTKELTSIDRVNSDINTFFKDYFNETCKKLEKR